MQINPPQQVGKNSDHSHRIFVNHAHQEEEKLPEERPPPQQQEEQGQAAFGCTPIPVSSQTDRWTTHWFETPSICLATN